MCTASVGGPLIHFFIQQGFMEGWLCASNCGGNQDEKQVVPVLQEFITGWEYMCVIKDGDLF